MGTERFPCAYWRSPCPGSGFSRLRRRLPCRSRPRPPSLTPTWESRPTRPATCPVFSEILRRRRDFGRETCGSSTTWLAPRLATDSLSPRSRRSGTSPRTASRTTWEPTPTSTRSAGRLATRRSSRPALRCGRSASAAARSWPSRSRKRSSLPRAWPSTRCPRPFSWPASARARSCASGRTGRSTTSFRPVRASRARWGSRSMRNAGRCGWSTRRFR